MSAIITGVRFDHQAEHLTAVIEMFQRPGEDIGVGIGLHGLHDDFKKALFQALVAEKGLL